MSDADKLEKFDIVIPDDDNPVDTKLMSESTTEDDVPTMDNPKWSDYVLSSFENDEVIDGNPTVDGLRRVTNKILGPIVISQSKIVQAPNFLNNNHATVEHTVGIRFDFNDVRMFTDCADVSYDNTHPDFAIYPSATAATRAEGRALRKALQLKRVVAAEEVGDVPASENRKINSGQISFINMVCERMDININSLLNMGKEKYNKIDDIPYATAVLISKYLSECQRGKDNKGNPRIIPENIKGYDSNWRN